MNFKFICEGLSKKIIFSILTVIQFTIVVLCIYIGIGTLNEINKSINSINGYFDEGNYYKINGNLSINKGFSIQEDDVKKNIVDLKEIKSYFDNNKNIEFLSVRSDEILMKKDLAITETIVSYIMVSFDNTDYIRTQGFCVNKNFMKNMDYEFLDGSIEDFEIEKNKEYIPVILGNTYSDKYSVGDMIETLDFDETGDYKKSEMKVIGILSENNYVHQNGISSERQSLNNAILFPFDENITLIDNGNAKMKININIELKNYLDNGYAILNNSESAQDINNDLLKFETKYQLEDLTKSMEDYKYEYIEQLKPGIYMAGIVIIFSVISVVVVMINAIAKEKKEFGINIMIGATMRNIRVRVLGQVFLLLGISIVFLGIILKSFDSFRFNIIDLILTIGVMLGILIIISIIIILSLNKYSINDLIRRNE